MNLSDLQILFSQFIKFFNFIFDIELLNIPLYIYLIVVISVIILVDLIGIFFNRRS